MSRLLFLLMFMVVCLFWGNAQAVSWYKAPFSANIVLINPTDDKDRAEGKLFVGLDRFRAEGVYKGVKKVLIVNMTDRRAYALLPDKKEFHEGMTEALMPPRPDVERMPSDPKGPCKTDQQLSCKQEGNATIQGIQTEKWTVKATAKEVNYLITLWIDPTRQIVIKQQTQDGPLMERKLLGVEKIEGRDTEKWEFTHSVQDKKRVYQQWIDVALRVPVKMGEGRSSAMEISHIQEGVVDAALFEVPKDYKEVKLPSPPPAPAAGQDGQSPLPPPQNGQQQGGRFQ